MGMGPKASAAAEIPKGWMGIRVAGEGESPEKFIVPVSYLNHPLFLKLLKEAEDEFGFEHQGAITLPCRVRDFRRIRTLIDTECSALARRHNTFGIAVGCFWL